MQVQALPFGQRASITGAQRTLDLVSDGKVDYFDETYYGQPNDQVDLRLEQGVISKPLELSTLDPRKNVEETSRSWEASSWKLRYPSAQLRKLARR